MEYVDHGVSGSTDRRPALDRLVKDARQRKFDVLVTWKLDRLRLGRNLKHLITFLEDLQALGVAFVSLGEGIDATTPAGKLQMHLLGAIAESNAAGSSSACGRASPGPRRRGNVWAGSRTRFPTRSSRPWRTARSATQPRRSASAAPSCTGGGCHANPSHPARVSPRKLRQNQPAAT